MGNRVMMFGYRQVWMGIQSQSGSTPTRTKIKCRVNVTAIKLSHIWPADLDTLTAQGEAPSRTQLGDEVMALKSDWSTKTPPTSCLKVKPLFKPTVKWEKTHWFLLRDAYCADHSKEKQNMREFNILANIKKYILKYSR